jgi:hypothetical protein
MHHQHELFINGINKKLKMRIMFFSKEDNSQIIRICAPMDYAPSRRAKTKDSRYHFWDYESDKASHTLSLPSTQIVSMELLTDVFEPREFITWDTKKSPWAITRDWGMLS